MQVRKTPLERARLYELTSKSSGDYKRLDLMYKLHRICNSLKIPNPERIYTLYISRLHNRMRLECNIDSLELIVAVLYYIDECISRRCNDIRDILSRLTIKDVNIKKFVKLVSKLCIELNIKELPVVDNHTLLLNILDQLREYSRRYINDDALNIIPKTTTTILSNINQFIELNDLLNNPINYGLDLNFEDNKNDSTVSKDYSHFYKTFCIKYDLIESTVLNILNFIEGNNNINILDPNTRKSLSCRKTLLSCIIYLVCKSLSITITPLVLIKGLNIPKTNFYRTKKDIISKIAAILSGKFNIKLPNNAIIPLFYNNIVGVDGKLRKNEVSINDNNNGEIDISSILPHQLIEAVSRYNGYRNKCMFNKTIECLNIINDIKDDINTKNNTSIIHEQNGNRIIYRWKEGKITRRKSFSINKYGYTNAYKLAVLYSKLKS